MKIFSMNLSFKVTLFLQRRAQLPDVEDDQDLQKTVEMSTVGGAEGEEEEEEELDMSNLMTLDEIGIVEDEAGDELEGGGDLHTGEEDKADEDEDHHSDHGEDEEGHHHDAEGEANEESVKVKKEEEEEETEEKFDPSAFPVGEEYVELVEVYRCSLCNTYLPRCGPGEESDAAIKEHCVSESHRDMLAARQDRGEDDAVKKEEASTIADDDEEAIDMGTEEDFQLDYEAESINGDNA